METRYLIIELRNGLIRHKDFYELLPTALLIDVVIVTAIGLLFNSLF